MANLILAINPGSTSTKIGLFNGLKQIYSESYEHTAQELHGYTKVTDQKELRLKYIDKFLAEHNVNITDLKVVVGRGGLLKPVSGGTYEVNEKMIVDLKKGVQGEHASNLGGIMAKAVGTKAHCPAFIVDPVVVDELMPLARFTGLPELKRRSVFHALNQKAVARIYANDINKKYEQLDLIVAHLGGGISVGLHHQGRVIDVNNALGGEGPFSPNRSGELPIIDLVTLYFSHKYSSAEIRKLILKKGGLVAHLNTNDLREVEKLVKKGNGKAKLVFEAMVYQVGKEIGSLAPVLSGKIDAIILTGGMAYSKLFTKSITEMVSFIAPVWIYPGEEELPALAAGAYRVLSGQEKVKIYR